MARHYAKGADLPAKDARVALADAEMDKRKTKVGNPDE